MKLFDKRGAGDRRPRETKEERMKRSFVLFAIALLILLMKPRSEGNAVGLFRRCPVCDHRILGRASYCSECGSKVTA